LSFSAFVCEGEVNEVGDRVLVARGGSGGIQSNQYVGQKGDALSVMLDLKVISDIGFVGYVIDKTLWFVSVIYQTRLLQHTRHHPAVSLMN